jgi:hypothetical protein
MKKGFGSDYFVTSISSEEQKDSLPNTQNLEYVRYNQTEPREKKVNPQRHIEQQILLTLGS